MRTKLKNNQLFELSKEPNQFFWTIEEYILKNKNYKEVISDLISDQDLYNSIINNNNKYRIAFKSNEKAYLPLTTECFEEIEFESYDEKSMSWIKWKEIYLKPIEEIIKLYLK